MAKKWGGQCPPAPRFRRHCLDLLLLCPERAHPLLAHLEVSLNQIAL